MTRGAGLRAIVLAAAALVGTTTAWGQTDTIKKCFRNADGRAKLDTVIVQPVNADNVPVGEPVHGDGCFTIPEGHFQWSAPGFRTQDTHTVNGMQRSAIAPGLNKRNFYGSETGAPVTVALDEMRTTGGAKNQGFLEGMPYSKAKPEVIYDSSMPAGVVQSTLKEMLPLMGYKRPSKFTPSDDPQVTGPNQIIVRNTNGRSVSNKERNASLCALEDDHACGSIELNIEVTPGTDLEYQLRHRMARSISSRDFDDGGILDPQGDWNAVTKDAFKSIARAWQRSHRSEQLRDDGVEYDRLPLEPPFGAPSGQMWVYGHSYNSFVFLQNPKKPAKGRFEYKDTFGNWAFGGQIDADGVFMALVPDSATLFALRGGAGCESRFDIDLRDANGDLGNGGRVWYRMCGTEEEREHYSLFIMPDGNRRAPSPLRGEGKQAFTFAHNISPEHLELWENEILDVIALQTCGGYDGNTFPSVADPTIDETSNPREGMFDVWDGNSSSSAIPYVVDGVVRGVNIKMAHFLEAQVYVINGQLESTRAWNSGRFATGSNRAQQRWHGQGQTHLLDPPSACAQYLKPIGEPLIFE